VAPEVIKALRSGADDVPEEKAGALAAFTKALVRSGGLVGEGEIGALLGHGYSRAQVLEVITQAVYTTMANWAANATGTALDGALSGYAWSSS
jgi:alkylhydroperoxidase family enzyme